MEEYIKGKKDEMSEKRYLSQCNDETLLPKTSILFLKQWNLNSIVYKQMKHGIRNAMTKSQKKHE